MRLIDADALEDTLGIEDRDIYVKATIREAPTIDTVPAERYNDLWEAFVDFVCSGIHNPAPYCKNKCDGCTNERGWCLHDDNCRGFNPDGRAD